MPLSAPPDHAALRAKATRASRGVSSFAALPNVSLSDESNDNADVENPCRAREAIDGADITPVAESAATAMPCRANEETKDDTNGGAGQVHEAQPPSEPHGHDDA
jgi:hypothetical protein